MAFRLKSLEFRMCCIICAQTLWLTSCTLVAEVDGSTYWRAPFNNLCNPRQLEEFIVMDTEIIRDQKLGAGAGLRSTRVSVSVCVLLQNRISGNIALFGSKINSGPLHYPWTSNRTVLFGDRGGLGTILALVPLFECCYYRCNCQNLVCGIEHEHNGFKLIYIPYFVCLCVLQHILAEVWVQKTSEMNTSQQYHCRTFLGHLLNIGDMVLGWVSRVDVIAYKDGGWSRCSGFTIREQSCPSLLTVCGWQ